MSAFRHYWAALLTVAHLGFCGCEKDSSNAEQANSSGSKKSAKTDSRFKLRVSLYRWIPKPGTFFTWIENDFERRHPDIDLIVRSVKDADKLDLSYKYEAAARALKGEGNIAQDLIEIDTVTLGFLVENEAVAPFSVDASYLPFAESAVELDGETYGVPHWTCGYFIISENDKLQGVDSVSDLLKVLAEAPGDRIDLAGNMDGSWESILIYLDSVRDTDAGADLEKTLESNSITSSAKAAFTSVGKSCTKAGVNYCGDYQEKLFAMGKASALFGYSERLNAVLAEKAKQVDKNKLLIISAPLGEGSHPTLFTDALVLSSRCNGRCREAAMTFAEYYVSDETFEVALLAKDVGDESTPRYLLPSTESAFKYGKVVKDRFYKQLHDEIAGAQSFPNRGVPQARKKENIRKAMQAALGFATDER